MCCYVLCPQKGIVTYKANRSILRKHTFKNYIFLVKKWFEDYSEF